MRLRVGLGGHLRHSRRTNALHCIIRPILLFRKWEDISRAIIGLNMWSECVECYPHHFRAVQAHALASRPGHGAESPRRVYLYYCCTLHHSSSNIIVSQVGGSLEGNNRRKYVGGVCRMLPTPLSSRASAHYKTISLIISPIISSELIVRTIGLIVRALSPPWDPGG